MPNSSTHRIAAAIAVGGVLAYEDVRHENRTLKPLTGSVVAAIATNLPDVLEPALHPHHRQFFHSIAFAGLVGWGTYKVYQWKPEDSVDDILRFLLLVIGGAYLIHLALDAGTPRSLPIVGKV